MCCTAQHPSGRLMGYGTCACVRVFVVIPPAFVFFSYRAAYRRIVSPIIQVLGKAEGSPHDFHGHVTALTVAPEYRRLSLSRILMHFLETASDDVYSGLFVDLYVRCTNSIAIDLYEGLGYSVYRRVREYYGSFGLGPGGKDEEDAFGPFLSSLLSFAEPATHRVPDTPCVDMRKPLSRDPYRRSVRPNGRDMIVSAHDVS